MLMLLVLLSGSLCRETKIENLTQFPWNDNDQAALDRAKFVCSHDDRYTDTPCLVKFTKKEERGFLAICGVSNER